MLKTLLMATAIVAPTVAAAQTYPEREITLIVAFPPGGSVDLTARALAPALEKAIGQPVVVVNRPGAAAAIGTQAAAIADPDGYTLMVATTQVSVLPAVDEVFERTPVFTRDQFKPIARISTDAPWLAVNAETPWTTVADLVADAKARPGEITYASGGLYGVTHLPVEMLVAATGVEMQHLPTAGGGPALTAVLGNNAQLLAVHPGVASPQIAAGTIRPIATWGAERNPTQPGVPTLKELGTDVEYYMWQGFFAPKDVPDDVVKTLEEATARAVQDPDFLATMANAGSVVAYQGADAFQAWWDADSDRLAGLVRAIGQVE